MKLIFSRFLTFFLPLLSLGSLITIVYNNRYFYIGVFFSLLLVLAGSYLMVIKEYKSRFKSLSFAFFAVLLLLSGEFYLVLADNLIIQIVVAVFTNILIYIYLAESLSNILSVKSSALALEEKRQLFLFLETPMVFLITAAFFGLRDFLNISIFLIIILFFFLMIALTSYFFQGEQLRLKKTQYILIISLIMGELFWSINIFSSVYYLKGFIMALFYFLGTKLLISSWEGKFSKKILINYLIIILVILGAILLTAQWF